MLLNYLGLIVYLTAIAFVTLKSIRSRNSEKPGIRLEAMGSEGSRGGTIFVAMFIAATMLGPADAMALSQNGLKYGLIWAVFPIGAALAQAVTGLFFVKQLHSAHSRAITIGDIFATNCTSSARFVVGLVVVLQSIAFTGVLVLAGGQVFEAFLSIDRVYGIIFTALFVGVYTSKGGMSAVVNTDRVQFAFMLGMLAVLLLVSGIYITSNGVTGLLKKPAFSSDYGVKELLTLFTAYFLGELLLPAYSIRSLLSKNAGSAKRGFLLASFLLVFWYCTITLAGSIGGQFANEYKHANDDLILLDVVRYGLIKDSLPWNLAGVLMFAGLLGLIHSTCDSFLNSGAIALARDVIGFRGTFNEETQGWIARQATVTIAIAGIVVAIAGDSLIGILIIGYTIWVPSLLAPYAWILLHSTGRLSAIAFWLAILAGTSVWYVTEYVVDLFVPGILAGFLANCITLFLVENMTQKGS